MQAALLLDVCAEIRTRALGKLESLRLHRLRKDGKIDRHVFKRGRYIGMRDSDKRLNGGFAREEVAGELGYELRSLRLSA